MRLGVARSLQALFTLGGVWALASALGHWHARDALAQRVVPVVAEVLRSDYLALGSGRGGARCETHFRFRYEVEGETRYGTRLAQWSSRSRCRQSRMLIRANPRGTSVEVFHDPANPDDAFAFAYAAPATYIAVPALGLIVLWLVALAFTQPSAPPRASARRGNWFLLTPTWSSRLKSNATIASAAWWISSSALAWFAMRRAALGDAPEWYVLAIPAAVALLLVVLAIAMWTERASFSDVAVAVDPYPLPAGGSFRVRVRFRLRRAVPLKHVEARLRVDSIRHPSSTPSAESVCQERLDIPAGIATTVERDLELPVPTESGAGESLSPTGPHRHRWTLRVIVAGAGFAQLDAVHVVEPDFSRHG